MPDSPSVPLNKSASQSQLLVQTTMTAVETVSVNQVLPGVPLKASVSSLQFVVQLLTTVVTV